MKQKENESAPRDVLSIAFEKPYLGSARPKPSVNEWSRGDDITILGIVNQYSVFCIQSSVPKKAKAPSPEPLRCLTHRQ